MRGHLQQRGADALAAQGLPRPRRPTGRSATSSGPSEGHAPEADQELARLVVEVDEGRHVRRRPDDVRRAARPVARGEAPTVEPSTVSNYEWIARQYVRAGARRPQGRDAPPDRARRALRRLRLSGGSVVARCRPDGADLPHGDAPVARAGAAVGPHRPQPGRRRHPAPSAGAARSRRRRSTRCATCSPPPSTTTPTSASTCGCSPPPAAGEARAARCDGRDIDLDTGELVDPPIDRPRRAATPSRRTQDPPVPPAGHRRGDARRCSASTGCAPGAGARARRPPRRRRVPVREDPSAPRRGDPTCAPTASAGCGRRSASSRSACTTCATSWRPCSATPARPIATISARLGHRDTATTLNIYTHALPATDPLAAETISRLIGDPRRQHGS